MLAYDYRDWLWLLFREDNLPLLIFLAVLLLFLLATLTHESKRPS